MKGLKITIIEDMKSAATLMRRSHKGFSGNIMAMVLVVILIVAVAIPVTSDVVSNSTATGTTRTILNLLVLFLALGALFFIARASGMA